MEAIKKYEFEGNEIEFDVTTDNIMVNATEMAQAFDKKINDFLRLEPTKEYVKALIITVTGISRNGDYQSLTEINEIPKILRKVQGGIPELQGTWMCKELALEFARWLSPEFSIWCNRKIMELLTTGRAEINNGDIWNRYINMVKTRHAAKRMKTLKKYELLDKYGEIPEIQEYFGFEESLRKATCNRIKFSKEEEKRLTLEFNTTKARYIPDVVVRGLPAAFAAKMKEIADITGFTKIEVTLTDLERLLDKKYSRTNLREFLTESLGYTVSSKQVRYQKVNLENGIVKTESTVGVVYRIDL